MTLKKSVCPHSRVLWFFCIVTPALLFSGCGLQALTVGPPSTFTSYFTPTPVMPTPTATAMSTPPLIGNEHVNAPAVSGSAQPTDARKKLDYCNPAVADTLQEITSTPASPYFVRHPRSDDPRVPTVIFLGGGSGSRRSAQRAWSNYLSGGSGREAFRIVVPYSVDIEYIDEAVRTFGILSEVLVCYGGDPTKVHLGGVSNGGFAAFALMLARPQRFATLLGAPGAFPRRTEPEAWAKAFAGRAIFNGVGDNDIDWKPDVKATHDALVVRGVNSVYVEFPGQGHTVNEAFDETVFFDFWARHSR